MEKIQVHVKNTLDNVKAIAIGAVLATVFFVLISAKSPAPANIDKYQTITAESKNELDSDVGDYLKKGWRPLGGVSMSYNKYGSQRFAQAMVK